MNDWGVLTFIGGGPSRETLNRLRHVLLELVIRLSFRLDALGCKQLLEVVERALPLRDSLSFEPLDSQGLLFLELPHSVLRFQSFPPALVLSPELPVLFFNSLCKLNMLSNQFITGNLIHPSLLSTETHSNPHCDRPGFYAIGVKIHLRPSRECLSGLPYH